VSGRPFVGVPSHALSPSGETAGVRGTRAGRRARGDCRIVVGSCVASLPGRSVTLTLPSPLEGEGGRVAKEFTP
jgi:hypothetical protein